MSKDRAFVLCEAVWRYSIAVTLAAAVLALGFGAAEPPWWLWWSLGVAGLAVAGMCFTA